MELRIYELHGEIPHLAVNETPGEPMPLSLAELRRSGALKNAANCAAASSDEAPAYVDFIGRLPKKGAFTPIVFY